MAATAVLTYLSLVGLLSGLGLHLTGTITHKWTRATVPFLDEMVIEIEVGLFKFCSAVMGFTPTCEDVGQLKKYNFIPGLDASGTLIKARVCEGLAILGAVSTTLAMFLTCGYLFLSRLSKNTKRFVIKLGALSAFLDGVSTAACVIVFAAAVYQNVLTSYQHQENLGLSIFLSAGGAILQVAGGVLATIAACKSGGYDSIN